MNKNLLLLLVGLLGLGAGSFGGYKKGYAAAEHEAYQDGQLHACGQIFSVMNGLMGSNLTCVKFKGQVVVEAGDAHWTLDGKRID